ncbi:serine hydrolase domain-containing protein [Halopseudomonas bauzanensis]|uniref:Beta-lactamase family protein n=1 Tax=Halopseudomonas bauzanensis TaxID=653930 RepID=A0A4U0YQ10_9GAMM|nr:serine hydrolase domain-containing protein [Halopseudomonas bauzanensis]TKA93528.1 beta-lactamase family protein [Halopseudomonas bauzanensis]
MAPRLRLMVLLTGLALTGLFLWQQRASTSLPKWHYPSVCNQGTPEWLPKLMSIVRELNYPGFQLAYHAADGNLTLCAAGWAHTAGLPQPMSNEHRMRYASLSKIMTSLEAAMLGEQGHMQLRQTLPSLLGLPKEPGRYVDPRIININLQQLLSHTAGFDRSLTPDPMMNGSPWCPDNLSALMNMRLDHTPGAKYAYSNVGYCLIGAAITRVHQRPLSQVFEERFIIPLQLDSMQLALNEQLLSDEAQPHFALGESIKELLRVNYANAVATGAWTGTAKDFSLLLAAYFGKKHHLLPAHIREFLATEPGCNKSAWRHCYGLAFYYQLTPDGKVGYWRDGSLPGVTALAMLFPDGSNLVFLSNSRPHNWMKQNDQLGKVILQLVHPGEERTVCCAAR